MNDQGDAESYPTQKEMRELDERQKQGEAVSRIDPRLLRDERIEALEATLSIASKRIAELEARAEKLRERAVELCNISDSLVSGRFKYWTRATIVECLEELAKGFRRALAATSTQELKP